MVVNKYFVDNMYYQLLSQMFVGIGTYIYFHGISDWMKISVCTF